MEWWSKPDGTCILAFKSADPVDGANTAWQLNGHTDRWGVNGVHSGLVAELEPLISQVPFASLRSQCSGPLMVAGHSMGGGLAQLLALALNNPQDALGAQLTVDSLYLYGPMAVSQTRQANPAQVRFVLAGERQDCPAGQEITDVATCQEAYNELRPQFRFPARRSLQQGAWIGVPKQCSIQFQGSYVDNNRDCSPHFSTASTSNNNRMPEFRAMCRAPAQARFVLAGERQDCPAGQEITDVATCQQAYDELRSQFRFPARRSLQHGSWGGVPKQCSIQFQGSYVDDNRDMSPHFSTASTSNNNRMPEFRAICRVSGMGCKTDSF